MKIFVDTSAWIAHFNRNAEFHKLAKNFFSQKPDLATSNAVLHETIAHLTARLSKQAAEIAGDFILSQAGVELVLLTMKDEIAAWARLKDLKFSVSSVDMTNVVLMERLNMSQIFAFDKDFSKMGLKVIP